MDLRRHRPLIILFALTLGGMFLHYHKVIFAPNTTYMSDTVDGLKNYYTPWYHAKYDDSFIWFEGMNHPYGEHLVYTDAQPLLSNGIKFVSEYIVDISDFTVGILNVLLLFSIVLTAWLLYKIFGKFGVEPLYAAFAAAGITFLSPQLLKLSGHYALAYTFYVPLLWWLALRFFERHTWNRSLLLGGVVYAFAWLHPYYLMIAAVFLGALWLFHFLFQSAKISLAQRILHFNIQVIVPILAFMVLLSLTDPVGDRPANPYGFEEYHATWRTLFLPYAVPGLDFVKAMQSDAEASWEGIGYVGMMGGLAFLFFWGRTALRSLRRFRQKKAGNGFIRFLWRDRRLLSSPSIQPLLAVSVLAGLAVALFACGFPFAIKPELSTDLFPPIKQFRSLGRFAWVFYYTWSVFAFYLLWLLHKRLRQKGRRKLAMAMMVLPLLVLFSEGLLFNTGIRNRMAAVETPLMAYGQEAHPAWMQIANPGAYSCFAALPFFHEGSENFSTLSAPSYQEAFAYSVRTGLPMMNVMMSRTSLKQSWNMFQMLGDPLHPLSILEDLDAGRPVLGIRIARRDSFDGIVMQPSTPLLYDDVGVQVYPIYFPKALYPLGRKPLGNRELPPLPEPGGPLYNCGGNQAAEDCGDLLYHKIFEGGEDTSIGAFPHGHAKELSLKDNNWLFEGQLPVKAGDTVVISIWLDLAGDGLPNTLFGVEEKGPGGEDILWSYPPVKEFVKRMRNSWVHCEREIIVHDPANTIRVNITRWKRKPPVVKVSDLMIYKKGSRIYFMEQGKPAGMNNRMGKVAEQAMQDSVKNRPAAPEADFPPNFP